MGAKRTVQAVVALAAVFLLWGCSSGGGGERTVGTTTVDENTPDEPSSPFGDGETETENDDADLPAGGAEEEEAPIPVIDCSGRPFEETGVNLTPYYEEIPSYSLPEEVVSDLRPASLDYSDSLPPPCHQGQLRSCAAWQLGYGMMSFLASTRLEYWGPPDRSDRQFSPTFLFNQTNGFVMERSRADSCVRSASFVSDVMSFLEEQGCALMCDVPHANDLDCETLRATAPLDEVRERARQYRIAYHRKIDHDAETVKSYLFEELLPLVVFRVGPEFEGLSRTQLYETVESEGSAHALLVVGYDDTRGAFKVFNSWGTGWGDQGYGWVSYAIWLEVVAEAWVAAPAFSDEMGALIGGFDRASNPYLDCDGDGLPDSMEREFAEYGLNPLEPDGTTNSDLLMQSDADHDGWPDNVERRFGTDPDAASSFPFMPGFDYPAGFFDTFADGTGGVLESDLELLDPSDDSDEDGDGVPGSADLCPDTPPGTFVDGHGCVLEL